MKVKLTNVQVEIAASTEASRYTLQAVKLDVSNKRLAATDGHILAIVPVEDCQGDHDALIPVDAFKKMRKMQREAKSIPLQIAVNGKVTVTAPQQTVSFDLTPGQFPNIDAVIPKFDGPPTVTLDAELLLRLAKAIEERSYRGVFEVALWVKDANSPILVKGTEEGALGVIMPMRGKHTAGTN